MDKLIAHILMVDDDDGIRSLVKKYLNENNYLVTTADSAEDASEKINIMVISTSEIKISVLIEAPYMELAARSLHTAFNLDESN